MSQTATKEHPYSFGNDFYSSARLNYLHSLFKQQDRNLLHASIPLNNPTLRIADIGAGTCIWLMELSDELHSAQLDGFDISAQQYPPKQWLPPNVSLHTHDAFSLFPQDMIGQFDIVHIQLFVTAIKDNDPTPLMENLATLLKPGGYLQWSEVDASSGSMVLPIDPSVSTEASNQLFKFMLSPRKGHSIKYIVHAPSQCDSQAKKSLVNSWIPRLPDLLEQNGLQSIASTRHTISPRYYPYWTVTRLWWASELAKTVHGGTPKEKEINDLVERAWEESQQGVAITADVLVVVGRKPSM